MASGNPDQENRTNALTEHHVKSAIETVLSNTEQSYEEFMGCFIGLKKEDVVAHQARQLHKMLKKQEANDPAEGQRSAPETESLRHHKPSKLSSGEEEIETEELGEGHYAPTRTSEGLSPGHRFVQMDNFVDDAELLEEDTQEGDNNDEDLASSQYDSSFGLVDSSNTSSPLKLSKDLISRIGGMNDSENEHEDSHKAHLGGGCEMRTLPGEAEEEEEEMCAQSPSLSADAVHQTELQLSTRRNQEPEGTDEALQVGTSLKASTDEVQPFSLDADFDYDNVSLTPKWDLHHRPPGWNPGQ